jgi:hypothetical protein
MTWTFDTDSILDLIHIAGRMNMSPDTDYTVEQLCERGTCTLDNGLACLRLLSYLGDVECMWMPNGEARYRLSGRNTQRSEAALQQAG